MAARMLHIELSWRSLAPVKLPTSPTSYSAPFSSITTLALYSWNIDCMLPFAEARMFAALAHLNRLTKLAIYVTDLEASSCGFDLYGITMLLDHRLQIVSYF